MAADITDKLLKAAVNWVGAVGSGGVSDAVVTTVPLVSATGLPTDTAIDIVIDRVDANGTATPSAMEVIKGVVSGLNIINCERGTEGTAQAHAAGAIVEVMLTADMWDSMIDHHLTEHNQDGTHKTTGTVVTKTGTQTLTNKTLTAPVIGGHSLFEENGALQLDSALSADGKYCGIIEAGTAGATLAFGDLVYFQASDSRWELVDANLSAGYDKKLGICVLAAAADGDATVILLYGKIRADAKFPTFTIAAPVYMSETAGAVVVAQPTTADAAIRIVGFGNTADELFFNPSPDYMTHI